MTEQKKFTSVAGDRKMHWLYLLCGGFIIGILAWVFATALWGLVLPLRKLGMKFSPFNFIRRCWGYW